MRNFDIRRTETKLITFCGQPVTAKTTNARSLGQCLNAPVFDLDLLRFDHIEKHREKTAATTKLPMLENESGRDYWKRCLFNDEVCKENLMEALGNSIYFTENRTNELLKKVTSLPEGMPKKEVEEKLGKLNPMLEFCPEHFTKKYVILSYALLGRMRQQVQAYATIGTFANREQQKEMAKVREGMEDLDEDEANRVLDRVFYCYSTLIAGTDAAAKYRLHVLFSADDKKEVLKIGKCIQKSK